MKVHEQRDILATAIEVVLSQHAPGPATSEFDADDCARAHMDYFFGVDLAVAHLADALAQTRGTTAAEETRRATAPARR